MTCLLLSFNGATESLSENARTLLGKTRRKISTRRPSEGPRQKCCSRCDIVLLDPVQTLFSCLVTLRTYAQKNNSVLLGRVVLKGKNALLYVHDYDRDRCKKVPGSLSAGCKYIQSKEVWYVHSTDNRKEKLGNPIHCINFYNRKV